MLVLSYFTHGCLRLLKNQQAAVAPLVAVTILTLIVAGGGVVDATRAQLVKAKVSSALDAAGLAAGATISTANVQAEAEKYFYANYPQGYMGTTVNNVTATANGDSSVITLSADVTLPNSFMKLGGMAEFTVRADAEITRASKGLELVMVLDNTGSMQYDMNTLKGAARDLVNIVYGNNETQENLWVGLVPFAQAVNIGTSHSSWIKSDSYNYGPSPWLGCVDARGSGQDSTDTPPSSNTYKFTRYFWPDDSNNNWSYTSYGNTYYYSGLGTSKGPNKYCSSEILPLSSHKQDVLDAIDAMEDNGNTHINLGAVWGWRMLSPRWRGYWGGEMDTNSLPLDYNTPLMSKAVIIMTDGENTHSNSSRTAYWYLSDGKLGTTNSSTAVTQLNNRLTSVCNSMKANNIIVYTIAFGNPGSSVENLLRNCATKTDYYFDSPTSSALQQAFHTIGDSLANLRVSK